MSVEDEVQQFLESETDIWIDGILLYLACLIVIGFVGLLKIFGRFRERNLEEFPENPSKLIISMNHPDGGNEWLFIYPHFFKPTHLVRPKLAIREYPSILVDKRNFSDNKDFKYPLVKRIVKRIFIPVDRREEKVFDKAFKECKIKIKNDGNLIGFFEGGRTGTGDDDSYKYSKKGKKIRKLKESLGRLALKKGAKAKTGWIEFPGSTFPCLQRNGRFSGLRFLEWYKRTLLGRNGRIEVIWGESKDLKNISKERATRELGDYLLKLGDKI